MITREEALKAVEAHFAERSLPDDEPVVVLDDETLERSWGWVFFHQSKRFVETGDVNHMLVGNAPVIVERESGRFLWTGTGSPIETYLANYEATGDPHSHLGRVLELVSTTDALNSTGALRLLRQSTELPLAEARRKLHELAEGGRLRIEAEDADSAAALCAQFRTMGVVAEQQREKRF